MSWRYQPVYREEGGERVYSVCEVYFDDAGTLEHWTADAAMTPVGNSVKDLTWMVAAMLQDCGRWEPVAFDDLCLGMTFERSVVPPDIGLVAALKRCLGTTRDGN